MDILSIIIVITLFILVGLSFYFQVCKAKLYFSYKKLAEPGKYSEFKNYIDLFNTYKAFHRITSFSNCRDLNLETDNKKLKEIGDKLSQTNKKFIISMLIIFTCICLLLISV